MLPSVLHDNERPGSKESSIHDPGFLAGFTVLYLLGSHLLEEDIEMQEFASCSFGQLSKLSVAVPKSHIQKIQRKLVLFERTSTESCQSAGSNRVSRLNGYLSAVGTLLNYRQKGALQNAF